jgi:D-sedoheptulose 7-phosphate isomerase
MNFGKNYLSSLNQILQETVVTDLSGNNQNLEDVLQNISSKLKEIKSSKNKLFFIGNGGSAGIASHQAVDYYKNGGVLAQAFNDSSFLTCLSNDYSFEQVFSRPVKDFGRTNDCLFAISSSGKSKNILNAAEAAKSTGMQVITFSGFDKANPLRKMGDINFYLNSTEYGFVEIGHLCLSHMILDNYMKNNF